MDDLEKQHPRPWLIAYGNAGVKCFDANGRIVWTEWDAGVEIAAAVVKAYNESANRSPMTERGHG